MMTFAAYDTINIRLPMTAQRIETARSRPSFDEYPDTRWNAVSLSEPSFQTLARIQKLNHYLGSLREQNEISPETAAFAWSAWKHLSNETEKMLPVPDAASGPNGELLYTWNKGEHHMELEVFADGKAEFFYRNRETEQLWEADYNLCAPLDPDTKERLKFFI